jgi:hypothetical protein
MCPIIHLINNSYSFVGATRDVLEEAREEIAERVIELDVKSFCNFRKQSLYIFLDSLVHLSSYWAI